jgi:hypothetical protein
VFVAYDRTVKNVRAAGVDITAYYWRLKGPNEYYDAKDKLPVVAPEFSNIENSDVDIVGSGYAYFEVPSCLAKA